ncbi:MAG: hypothetical protein H6737_16480 [Alphaproteobacteria bacterium]|nr:hypothetical protein [Alphaproteobacteria bacterium]
MSAFFMTIALLSACIRPSDDYEVRLYDASTELDQILPPGDPMGGQIEYFRFALNGSNLGLGQAAFFGDTPYQDGLSFVIGYADFGYPRSPDYDRQSNFLVPGPRDIGLEDACVTRIDASGYPGTTEYVDVGDHIALTAADGDVIRLERDPSSHPRPAGESFFASWGGTLAPALTDHAYLADTWRPDSVWGLSFPGTVVPPESSMGSVPYPLTAATVRFPSGIAGLEIDGEPVRPPHHDYDDDGVYTGERDEVRFAGPFERQMTLTWEPSTTSDPLTVSLRYLGAAAQGVCAVDADCDIGVSCVEGECIPDDGDGSVVLGELVCTVVDDGVFSLSPDDLEFLDAAVREDQRAGAVLWVARMSEGTVEIPDAMSYVGGRIPISPVRTRVTDVVVTRLDLP